MDKEKLKLVKKAIDIQLRKDVRKEAKELVLLASEEKVDELLKLHGDDNGNIFCICLDGIKYDLWKEGKLTKEQFPSFGEPFIEFHEADLIKTKKK